MTQVPSEAAWSSGCLSSGGRGMLSIRPKFLVWISGHFQWRKEKYLPEFPGAQDGTVTSSGIPKFSKISFRGFLIHLILLPKFLEIFGCLGWVVRILEIQQFTHLSKNFTGKFPYHLLPFRKFRNIWSNGKHPRVQALHPAT